MSKEQRPRQPADSGDKYGGDNQHRSSLKEGNSKGWSMDGEKEAAAPFVPAMLLNQLAGEPKPVGPSRADYLYRREQFIAVLRQHGVEVQGESWPYHLEWPGQQADFAAIRALESQLLAPQLTNLALQQLVRRQSETPVDQLTMQDWLTASEWFSALGKSDRPLADGNTVLPDEHILRVQELLDVDQIAQQVPATEPFRRRRLQQLLVWVGFWHDLGKVIDPKNKSHGVGSALMAQSYFSWRQQQAAQLGEPSPFSPHFIEQVVYLCEFHHLFEELSKFLTLELQLHPDRLAALQTNSSQQVTAFYQRYLQQRHLTQQIHRREFARVFQPLIDQPDLLLVVYFFTKADIASNPAYAKYWAQNKELWRVIMAGITSLNTEKTE